MAPFPQHQGVGPERRGNADDRPDVLDVGDVGTDDQREPLAVPGHHLIEGEMLLAPPAGDHAGVELHSQHIVHHLGRGDINRHSLRHQRPDLRRPAFGEKDRIDWEFALQQSANQVLAFSDEVSPGPVQIAVLEVAEVRQRGSARETMGMGVMREAFLTL